MINYKFGTILETADGSGFHAIASGKYDSDSQAEAQARRILESPECYDLTDMVTSLTIKRGDTAWNI